MEIDKPVWFSRDKANPEWRLRLCRATQTWRNSQACPCNFRGNYFLPIRSKTKIKFFHFNKLNDFTHIFWLLWKEIDDNFAVVADHKWIYAVRLAQEICHFLDQIGLFCKFRIEFPCTDSQSITTMVHEPVNTFSFFKFKFLFFAYLYLSLNWIWMPGPNSSSTGNRMVSINVRTFSSRLRLHIKFNNSLNWLLTNSSVIHWSCGFPGGNACLQGWIVNQDFPLSISCQSRAPPLPMCSKTLW